MGDRRKEPLRRSIVVGAVSFFLAASISACGGLIFESEASSPEPDASADTCSADACDKSTHDAVAQGPSRPDGAGSFAAHAPGARDDTVATHADAETGRVPRRPLDAGCRFGMLSIATFMTGLRPRLPAIGDVNGDGNLDVVVANWTEGNVGVLLGNGDGTLRPQATYPTSGYPGSVAIGDVNGDGKMDLAVANGEPSSVGVLLGNGDGTFEAQTVFAPGVGPSLVAIVDVTGDGRPDLVLLDDGVVDDVNVLVGNGDGTFQSPVTSAPMLDGPVAMATADLNGDGKVDLAVGGAGADGVAVLLGNGNGTFDTKGQYLGYMSAQSIGAADFNGDGKVDLVVADPNTYNVLVALGAGDGTFSYMTQKLYVPVATPTSIAIADMDGDGVLDLVFGTSVTEDSAVSTRVYVMLGNADGTFRQPVTFNVGAQPELVAIGDMNGDGVPDVVVTSPDGGAGSVLTIDDCGGTPGQPSAPSLCMSGIPCNHPVNYTCGEPDGPSCVTTCDCSTSGLFCEVGCP